MPDNKEHVRIESGENRQLQALQSNATAVKAVASAVESTIGPKGLDTMLVNEAGEVIITNDGVTILDRMEVSHPAAKMIVNVAKAQQAEVGDGTTTATLLATAIVDEGVKQVARGVPVVKVIAGIQRGVRYALHKMKEKARPIRELEDDWLQRIAFTASRENEDITVAVMEAVHLVGRDKLLENNFRLSQAVVAHPRATSAVFSGILLNKTRANLQMPRYLENAQVLVLADSLESEWVDDESLSTEAGFNKQEHLRKQFLAALESLMGLGVKLIVTSRGLDSLAEDILTDSGIMVIQRVAPDELQKVAEHTNAKILKRNGLYKPIEEIKSYLGFAEEVEDNEVLERVRVSGGKGKPFATILVSAATDEVVEERERITKDAASAVQAAVRGGYLPGGGALELSLARDVEKFRETVQGMERFGVGVVSEALLRPMTQVVANAGFNPLEKIEMVKALQLKRESDSLGIDCDRGVVVDMVEMGVVDPLLIKFHALGAAGEVATAILRIHSIVRMKNY
ncbi:chaperonin GroEL (HSP60 family) [Croceifilum oryzae]|uniref:Chaperonin GroEL (HSP60 family) n=1 Tax=Croceifilum oryzae TaxID=1553429 RepID=A0AAJ1TK83_9BACL|nr:TCP-1/cpn60 chaperonin family protein [Croceifilum oryzae]MDQ0416236.1 chaperonin GroEL (HSP60 family) [Croceifilum oryzae]